MLYLLRFMMHTMDLEMPLLHIRTPIGNQSRRHGRALVGLAPPNKSPSPPKWKREHFYGQCLSVTYKPLAQKPVNYRPGHKRC